VVPDQLEQSLLSTRRPDISGGESQSVGEVFSRLIGGRPRETAERRPSGVGEIVIVDIGGGRQREREEDVHDRVARAIASEQGCRSGQ